nr:nucleolar protein 12-like [Nomia melanderi]
MVKAVVEDNKDQTKDLLHAPKEGFIQKKKSQKFKQTPMGKVILINGSKTSNGNNDEVSKQLEKHKNKSSKKTAESKKEHKTKGSPKDNKKLQETLKKNEAQSEKDDSDLDEDINEGIVLEEHSFMQESGGSEIDNSDEDESEDEKNVPNILGTSLADDTDEDDEDYEEDEKVTVVKRGVKMFKGSRSNDKHADTSMNSINKSEIESDDDEEDEEDEENEENEEDEEDEEDEEVSNSNKEDNEDEVDDEEDDNDSDEESEDEEEGDEPTLNWEAILSNSIVEDDEDDEDFNELEEADDDDDEISDEDEDEVDDEEEEEGDEEEEDEEEEAEEEEENDRASNHEHDKKHEDNLDASLEKLKEDKRTIFVGNLPKEVMKKQLRKQFNKFGDIDTIRIRGIVGKSMKMSKRVAAIKKDIHPKLKAVFAYIRYNSEESAKAALSMNGKVFNGNYLRVDLASTSHEKHDVKKSVFVGNLNFNIDENTLWKYFKGCGEIESVRLVRDNKTGIGKGFGYINFKTEDAVALALELHGTKISNREIRVKPCNESNKKDKTKRDRRSHSKGEKNSFKKMKNNEEVPVPVHNKKNATKRLNEKGQKLTEKQTSPQQSKAFEGRKVDEKKKKKKSNKLEKKKKLLAEKLAAKPKKPSN